MGICFERFIYCYKIEKIEKVVSIEVNISRDKQEENNINIKSSENNSNNTIIFNFHSKFNNNKFNFKENSIKNKNTIKKMNRRKSLLNRYKYTDDKFDKYIKFTNINKNVSVTTNSFMN